MGLVSAWAVVGAAPAIAAPPAPGQPNWTGQYELERFAATKTGTSLAASQWEPDFSDVYTFATDCIDDTCVAEVVAGPKPANETLPQPAQYNWDGTSWVHEYDWFWDCYMGPGVEKPMNPASSRAVYTPQPDGTLTGDWDTTIFEGACAGTVHMDVAAYPVAPQPVVPPLFGSS